jgi:hypothetical protein
MYFLILIIEYIINRKKTYYVKSTEKFKKFAKTIFSRTFEYQNKTYTMKTTSKMLLAVGTISLIVAACTKLKQNDVTPSSAQTVAEVKSNTYSKTKPPKNPPNAHMQRYSSAGWCSYPPNDNCKYLKEVTVKAFTILNGLNDASAETVANTFANDLELKYIRDNMPDEFLTKLISGRYYIHTYNVGETEVSYIVGPSSPVNSENFEFGLHYTR